MDGKSRQEIRKYILVFLMLWLCVSAAFYRYADYEESKRRSQIAEFVAQYPKMEEEFVRIMKKGASSDSGVHQRNSEESNERIKEVLNRLEKKYGYEYVKCIKESRVWNLYKICILCIGSFLLILWLISGRKGIKTKSYYERLEKLNKILEEFSRGNEKAAEIEGKDFGIQNGGGAAVNTKEAEIWIKMEEALLELGMYLEDRKDKYEREEEATKELITNISHQLKTPLASLRMSHELVASNYLSEGEKKEFLMQEEKEIAKLHKLLDEMIKLSRLEKHVIQIQPERKSLRDTISDAVSTIYPKALTKSMVVQIRMEEDVIIFHDAHWTAEALANIMDNAVKYAPAETRIVIQIQKLTRFVLIEIIDEGPGISDREKHKIYQRFYRGAQSGKTEGAGVGLYLARQILEEQKGSILVKNHYPHGSNFQVLLPL